MNLHFGIKSNWDSWKCSFDPDMDGIFPPGNNIEKLTQKMRNKTKYKKQREKSKYKIHNGRINDEKGARIETWNN